MIDWPFWVLVAVVTTTHIIAEVYREGKVSLKTSISCLLISVPLTFMATLLLAVGRDQYTLGVMIYALIMLLSDIFIFRAAYKKYAATVKDPSAPAQEEP